MDTALPPDERAELLLARMTQDEQLQLVMGYPGANTRPPSGRMPPEELRPLLPGTAGYVPGIPRLGVPALIESDAGLGIANNFHLRPGDEATALPSGLATAATWNSALAEAAGSVIGAEARDRAFNVVLGGAMNLARETRGGRTFEYAGEDPLLAGVITGSVIRGIQSQHVICTVKHYALNDQETGRTVLSANIDETDARESDLLAFEIAVEQGDPGAAMCAYDRYNGTYACENDPLLNGVLKGDWKYPGWVLSDWGAVHSTAEAANGGLDQESSEGSDREQYFGPALKQAIADGKVTPQRLHDMVHRILRSMFAHGVFDYPATRQLSALEAHRQIVYRDAAEGMVLLKNERGILPLPHMAQRIALIGAHADVGMLSGGGSSQVMPIGHTSADDFPVGAAEVASGAKVRPAGTEIYDPPSPLATILQANPAANVQYADGEDVAAATELARQSDVVIVFARQWMSEGRDVPNLRLPNDQDALIQAVAAANPRTVVVLETGGPVAMPWLDQVGAVLEAWYAGNAGATALAQVLFGNVNPSGKLPITFPASEEQLPRPSIPRGAAPGAPFDIDYFEGANVGYRWFQGRNLTPLFPFGYGLSYSSFHLDGLAVTSKGRLTASVNVTNDGPRGGMETVQFYAALPDGTGIRRLIGWSKVPLKVHERRRVTIAPDPRLLARFDEAAHGWRVAAGDYIISAGASSASLPLNATVKLTAQQLPP
ncbi:MAG: glycoside hydrolase family 3 C-terminal domain-containing protein [Alphaproteobacteria bacterium]|nr:glycoside hydrolase family 3 C-terminal domain-containing protein [Alphaproteobacteria bacterium]